MVGVGDSQEAYRRPRLFCGTSVAKRRLKESGGVSRLLLGHHAADLWGVEELAGS